MKRKAVLAVPACGPGLGGGHLVRCAALICGLRELGREAELFLPDGADTASIRGLLAKASSGLTRFDPSWIVGEAGLRDKIPEYIILDNFKTTRDEFLRWTGLAPVIAIDEGGPCRNRFDFLIDILPNVSRIPPNLSDPSLLPLLKTSRPKLPTHAAKLKVLVSFGQEDSAELGTASAQALAASSGGSLELTLLKGGMGGRKPNIGNGKVNILEAIPKLSERLGEYGLVITHLGLTAFESLYAGVPVLLLSPTGLHEKVARKAGFLSLGVGKGRARKLAGLLLRQGEVNQAFLSGLEKSCKALAARHGMDRPPKQSLAELVNGFAPDIRRSCAACGGALRPPLLARFRERTYRRCASCRTITMNRLTPPPIEYGREYFFEFYEKQYGKTYIEDFPHLTAMGKRRLAVIKPLLTANDSQPILLDIGCAYGPFLAAARDEGFSPHGIDPSEDAVRYVTQSFGMPAKQGFFPCETGDPGRKYDAVTLWYVIEHFRDCVPVLAEIRRILKPGGVLAFATPSFSGISGRSSLGRFLEQSPEDHWTVWSPAACKKALAAAGFRVMKITSCGHHPERFPLLGKHAGDNKSPLYGLLSVASRAFSLGDTFEVYAVRV